MTAAASSAAAHATNFSVATLSSDPQPFQSYQPFELPKHTSSSRVSSHQAAALDRVFDRAFNKAAAAANLEVEKEEAALRALEPKVRTQADEDDELRSVATPMQVQDAVQRIQLAFREKDFFRLMGLPQPEADELGNPVWSCTSADVSKAYRRLSVVVHPDKNPGEEARTAFDQLNQAHKALKDPGQLEDHLRRAADGARRRRDAAEAAATPDERIALNAAKAERQKALRKQQGAQFQAEIARQLAEKKAAAKHKREVAARSRQRDEEDVGGLSEEDEPAAPHKALPAGSDDDDTVIMPVRRRGKKKAML